MHPEVRGLEYFVAHNNMARCFLAMRTRTLVSPHLLFLSEFISSHPHFLMTN